MTAQLFAMMGVDIYRLGVGLPPAQLFAMMGVDIYRLGVGLPPHIGSNYPNYTAHGPHT
jgi:hypothetical protein